MREQLIGFLHASILILGPGHRPNKRAHIAYDGELPQIPQRLKVNQIRMQAELRTDAGRIRVQRQQARLSNCKSGSVASGGVIPVAGRVQRDDRVVTVVSAAEKDANQSFVVGRSIQFWILLGKDIEHTEMPYARGDRRCAKPGTSGPAQKVSSCYWHFCIPYLCTWYCDEVATRYIAVRARLRVLVLDTAFTAVITLLRISVDIVL